MNQGFLHAFLTMRQTVNGTSIAHKKNSPLITICIEIYVILLVLKLTSSSHLSMFCSILISLIPWKKKIPLDKKYL